jgi:bifunctional UDP-N-acetylglucosamine pyrophosphorylase/glucosamine-1-phosphate N-acetyltransferase
MPAATLQLLTADDPGDFALLTARLEEPEGYGRIVRDAAGSVSRIVEQRDASDRERAIREINTGIMVVGARYLKRWLAALGNDNAQGEYYLTDIVGLAANDGVAVRAVLAEATATLLGINDKRQLAEAERVFQRARADELMTLGATLADPTRIDIRGQVAIGRDVFIDVNAVFEGRVTLGDNVRIGPNCLLKDTTLGAGTVVHANTVAEGLEAGAGCELGPFARLRPGAVLAERVKVGNFVEIKKSRVASDSKINHLSYVGDAEIGSGVNVGAGTITCNYDGAAKHRTRIGDGAFIGSGVMLVAPIDVGAGATIGAGSTLTKAAPPEELTLARSLQTTVRGWRRPRKPAK